MFTKILFPTDFSDNAQRAVAYIIQLKEAGSQEVVLLHVINQRIIDGLTRHGVLETDAEKWKKGVKAVAEESLCEIGRSLENFGFLVKRIIKTGYPSSVILDFEKQEKPSIIVVGSHGRSNIADMLLGSVSDRVIRKSKCPVLVVKRDD